MSIEPYVGLLGTLPVSRFATACPPAGDVHRRSLLHSPAPRRTGQIDRIAISVEACQALVATLPLGSAAHEPGSKAKGKRRFSL